MISGMDTANEQPPAPAPFPRLGSAAARLPTVLAAVAGCLFLVVATSVRTGNNLPPFIDTPTYNGNGGPTSFAGWTYLVTPVIATALGLCLLRWWPYLLAAAGLMAVPGIMADWVHTDFSWGWFLLPPAGYYLAVIAVLACAQGLFRSAAGWGAAVAALTMGSRLLGSAIAWSRTWELPGSAANAWHVALLALGLAALAPAVWRFRHGDLPAMGPAGGRSGQRIRMIIAGTLAAAVPIPLTMLTTQDLAGALGVTWFALSRQQTALLGTVTLVAVILLAALAGLWPLGATVTAALAQTAVVAPALLTITALAADDPARWAAALGAAALGAAAAGSRRRTALAGMLAVLAAISLFITYRATTGEPAKLADQQIVIPSVLILVLCSAAAAAVVGATAPALAQRGALPAVLGPLAGTLAVGALQTVQGTYLADGEPESSILSPIWHLTTSAELLLAVGAAIGGLGFAQVLATRRAERQQVEQIRLEAATGERDRLARSIHDGVLQVLALVQRQGPELGAEGGRLAALAGEQEVALRGLLVGGQSTGGRAARDLCAPLQALATPAVEVATPAQAVELPSAIAAEVVAAVRAALDNVRRHAGSGAKAWILLEDESDGVRVTVRDDGVGFPPQRPAEAAEAGRLGIAQSIRGRIADCGGSTTIESRPGEGTEVEFWVPRALPGRR